MDSNIIIEKINGFLYESAKGLVQWLNGILPRVTESWWDDCVLSNLSYSQRQIAEQNGYEKLSDFDLIALLRIANKSWYDMRMVEYLPTKDRECIREMINIRNTWEHCKVVLPGKDVILHDLKTIKYFIQQIEGNKDISDEIEELIAYVESPDSIKNLEVDDNAIGEESNENFGRGEITEKSLVYLVGNPERRGMVQSISEIGDITKYEVFIDGNIRTFYSGQIAAVEESSGYKWVDIDTFISYLTAYQINNPSSQNLYSLNSARIDFVPYQFRPALKMINADEPRILIADSVGVGKTIEAGLILKELEARKNIESVLVICPKPLVAERKWEKEMKKFDEDFTPLDGTTLRQIISDTDRDGEWPVRYKKAIIPYSILDNRTYTGESKKRGHSYGLVDLDPEPHFDLVIIDEAHHIRNGSMEKEKAFAYKCTKYFCDHADAVVMLTATPLQTSDDDLFTLLNILRPDVVIDKETFEMMSRPNSNISHCSRIIRGAGDNWNEKAIEELIKVRKTQWGDNVIAENPLYDDVLLRLEKGVDTREERVELISDVESLHSFNTMLNRTRRKDIQDFCVRRPHAVEVEFTERQLELHDELINFEKAALSVLHDVRTIPFMISTLRRQAASCIFGLAPYIENIVNRRFAEINDDPEIEFALLEMDGESTGILQKLAENIIKLSKDLPDEDPKFDEMYEIIMQKSEEENNKIMIFSTFRYTLAYIKDKLLQKGLRVEQIDGSVNDEERHSIKERFMLSKDNLDAVDIVLFTEVGAEGLDYQFCNMMINYDLPWNPMRIEQRIGRIDRRGQRSEVVNIYNLITKGTVDADIYYRCLARIGVFERSIGECDAILGEIASEIERIAVNSNLTESERGEKLEQMADNEVRKIQELSRLEDEEKELFGFDLSEYTTTQEIKKAENPWLTQNHLLKLIELYFEKRLGEGKFIVGDSGLKTLRLPVDARLSLLDDSRKLPGSRNEQRKQWENYLRGRRPVHSITFDADVAEKNSDCFFITSMHPLARQAAMIFSENNTVDLCLEYYSDTIPEGTYEFSVYAWKYIGTKEYTKLVTVSENEKLSEELPEILELGKNLNNSYKKEDFNWDKIEQKHIEMWLEEKRKHKNDMQNLIAFKLETLKNNYRNHKRTLTRQIDEAFDDSIKRMRMSELETVIANYEKQVSTIEISGETADIHTVLLANGVVNVKGE